MRLALAFFAVVLSAPAFAQMSYQEERAACLQVADEADRKTCLREAGAARVEAKRGGLTEQAEYQQNLLARCNYLPKADHEDCVRRMKGEGSVSGSVAGGGLYRELRTIVPADDTGSGATR